MLDFWANEGGVEEVMTVYEDVNNKFASSQIVFSDGYDLKTNQLKLSETKQVATSADVMIHPNHQLLVKELKTTKVTLL